MVSYDYHRLSIIDRSYVFFFHIFIHGETEEPAPIYGKGIAFWLGEHCENTCNRILFHVWCNSTTHRCECLQEYPVNVENKYCLKG